MKYLLAIDAGTGSIRAVLFDMIGNQISMEQKEWTHLEESGVPNSMSFDFNKNWPLVVSCIKTCIEQASINANDILALSATSMREGIVLYDKKGKELWAVANVDSRASKEVQELQKEDAFFEKDAYDISGQTFALGALPRILWLKNNKPELYSEVHTMSMLSDWILAKLSGVIASEPSNAGTSGIFNLEKRTWEKELALRAGIKDDIFPAIYETGTSIGFVSKEASEQTGLKTITKVVMGGGDVQLGSAGLGVVKVGDVAILGGSFWQQIVNIPKNTPPPSSMSIRVNPHVIKDLSQAEGITFFSGLVMKWFRDAFCDLEKLQAKEQNKDVYEILEEKAKEVPIGSHGILPIFSDSMKYGKWYHASPSFINLSLDASTCNKASMFRSLEENACIVSAINLEKIKEFSNIEINEIVFAGGASKGTLWPQILADVTGCTLKIPKVTEATALGAAMSAGVGAGIFASLEDASTQLVQWNKTYEANKNNTQTYRIIREKWIAVYEEQLKLVDKNLTTSMWKAPGL